MSISTISDLLITNFIVFCLNLMFLFLGKWWTIQKGGQNEDFQKTAIRVLIPLDFFFCGEIITSPEMFKSNRLSSSAKKCYLSYSSLIKMPIPLTHMKQSDHLCGLSDKKVLINTKFRLANEFQFF